MLWESLRSKGNRREYIDFTRVVLLLTLAVATSIDALAVGLSFAFLNVNIGLASVTIGVTAFAVTGSGFYIGRKVSGLIGKWAEIAGGIILIGIGLKILLEHIL